MLAVQDYSTFELQLVNVDLNCPVICALIYRPPKYNKQFIQEFSEFLTTVVPSFERILILGDFNLHICCPNQPMVKDFLHLIESFNFTQFVSSPTHKLGHTLDLILSLGVPVLNIDIEDACFSDHNPVIFNISVFSSSLNCKPLGRYVRSIKPSTASEFSNAYTTLTSVLRTSGSLSFGLGLNDIVPMFNSICNEIMDTCAPFKIIGVKSKPQPWLNNDTRCLRQVWRKAERQWKKDKLQVSYDILKDAMIKYQKAAKTAKIKYFSDLIKRFQIIRKCYSRQ